MLHHNTAKLGFLHGRIRQLTVFRNTAAREEKDIRVKIPHEILRVSPHKSNGVFEKQSARRQGTNL